MGNSAGEDTVTASPEDSVGRDGPADGRGKQTPPARPPPGDAFGWRGWLLVGMIVVSFLVIPAALLVLPAAQDLVSTLGLGFRDAYLVLPLPAAILLGALAVWAAVASRRE